MLVQDSGQLHCSNSLTQHMRSSSLHQGLYLWKERQSVVSHGAPGLEECQGCDLIVISWFPQIGWIRMGLVHTVDFKL